MVYFREEQRFNWVGTLMLVPSLVTAYGLYRQVWLGRPIGDPPLANALLWSVFAVSAAVAIWFLLLELIVEVRQDGLSIDFRLLWPVRAIEWREMRAAEVITYHPIKDYGGWGVRWAPRGIVYSVRGTQGVRIQLVSGERVLIGSQHAAELAQAITERIAAA